MNELLLNLLQCPHCGGDFAVQPDELVCRSCAQAVPLGAGIPLFTAPPSDLRPSAKVERGPGVGTPWRQANWRFLKTTLAGLPDKAVILDVGAGRGDFNDLLRGRSSIALDIYPYPEVDVVCDLTLVNPLRSQSVDAILLMNVLEHVYDTHAFLARLSAALKPGGLLLVAVPFMVKMHQIPVDFVRYTHYALQRLAPDHGLQVEKLEGFYHPASVLDEGIGNLKNAVLPAQRGLRHYAGRALLLGIQTLTSLLGRLLGPGSALPPAGVRSQAPTGYQVIFRKNG